MELIDMNLPMYMTNFLSGKMLPPDIILLQ